MASLHWQNAGKHDCEEWEYFDVTVVRSLVRVRQDFWPHSLAFSVWTGHLVPYTLNDVCDMLHFRYYLNLYRFLFKDKIIFRYLKSKTIFHLYFVDRASRYKFLLITNLTHFFMYVFISYLYMFRASQCSSSGDRIVLIHHLVWLVYVSDCLVCRSGGNFSSILTGIPSSHLHRLIIPDDVLIKFDLLMMSTVMPETCRDMK